MPINHKADCECISCHAQRDRAARAMATRDQAQAAQVVDVSALDDVLAERERQQTLWGVQDHDAGTWALILLEEIGEWAKAELHSRFGGPEAGNVHTEAVHTAAVALQIVEAIRRKQLQPSADSRRDQPGASAGGQTEAPNAAAESGRDSGVKLQRDVRKVE